MKARMFAVAALAALIGFLVPGSTPASDTSSIYKTLSRLDDNTILFVAVTEAKEAALLKGDAEYTLLAPTDEAFKKLDDDTIKKIASDKETVKQLLHAHLIPGDLKYEKLKMMNGMDVRALQGTPLKVTAGKDGLRIGGAKISSVHPCSNGMIHVIDTVLPFTK